MAFLTTIAKFPHCSSDKVYKREKEENGNQQYLGNNERCEHASFLLDDSYNGCRPEVKQRIVEMGLNGSGVFNTARVLKASPVTVYQRVLKKNIDSKSEYMQG